MEIIYIFILISAKIVRKQFFLACFFYYKIYKLNKCLIDKKKNNLRMYFTSCDDFHKNYVTIYTIFYVFKIQFVLCFY